MVVHDGMVGGMPDSTSAGLVSKWLMCNAVD